MELNDSSQSSISTNDSFMNIFTCGDNNYCDLIPFNEDQISFNEGAPFLDNKLKWTYYFYDGIDKEKAEKIKQAIEAKIAMKIENENNNVVICAIKDQIDQSKILFDELKTISPKHFKPIMVFISNDEKITQDSLRNLIRKEKYDYDIRFVYHVKHFKKELVTRLLKICSLYNQLGDEFIISNQQFTLISSQFPNNINIMLIGSPGCGKSTFMNKVFAEQRSLVRPGMSVTKRIISYHHKTYPLILYDTPGFENPEGQNELMALINKQLEQSRQKNYDLIHLILYFINAATRPFKQEDIDFLKKLSELKIPLMFIISHCNSEKESQDKKQELEKILNDNKIHHDLYMITPMNLIEPTQGFKLLFKSLYNTFNINHRIKDDTLDSKFESGNINGVINTLKSSIFFNCVHNENDLINRSSNKANEAIASFTTSELMRYLFSGITSHFNFTYDYELLLLIDISRCYGIDMTENEAMTLLDQWDLIQIMSLLSDGKISNLDGMEQTFEFTKQMEGFQKMDKEMFEIIYNHASPVLIKWFPKVVSNITRFKKYAIGLAMLGYKAKTYCQLQRANKNNYVDLIKKSVECYHKGIEALKLISEDKRFK